MDSSPIIDATGTASPDTALDEPLSTTNARSLMHRVDRDDAEPYTVAARDDGVSVHRHAHHPTTFHSVALFDDPTPRRMGVFDFLTSQSASQFAEQRHGFVSPGQAFPSSMLQQLPLQQQQQNQLQQQQQQQRLPLYNDGFNNMDRFLPTPSQLFDSSAVHGPPASHGVHFSSSSPVLSSLAMDSVLGVDREDMSGLFVAGSRGSISSMASTSLSSSFSSPFTLPHPFSNNFSIHSTPNDLSPRSNPATPVYHDLLKPSSLQAAQSRMHSIFTPSLLLQQSRSFHDSYTAKALQPTSQRSRVDVPSSPSPPASLVPIPTLEHAPRPRSTSASPNQSSFSTSRVDASPQANATRRVDDSMHQQQHPLGLAANRRHASSPVLSYAQSQSQSPHPLPFHSSSSTFKTDSSSGRTSPLIAKKTNSKRKSLGVMMDVPVNQRRAISSASSTSLPNSAIASELVVQATIAAEPVHSIFASPLPLHSTLSSHHGASPLMATVVPHSPVRASHLSRSPSAPVLHRHRMPFDLPPFVKGTEVREFSEPIMSRIHSASFKKQRRLAQTVAERAPRTIPSSASLQTLTAEAGLLTFSEDHLEVESPPLSRMLSLPTTLSESDVQLGRLPHDLSRSQCLVPSLSSSLPNYLTQHFANSSSSSHNFSSNSSVLSQADETAIAFPELTPVHRHPFPTSSLNSSYSSPNVDSAEWQQYALREAQRTSLLSSMLQVSSQPSLPSVSSRLRSPVEDGYNPGPIDNGSFISSSLHANEESIRRLHDQIVLQQKILEKQIALLQASTGVELLPSLTTLPSSSSSSPSSSTVTSDTNK